MRKPCTDCPHNEKTIIPAKDGYRQSVWHSCRLGLNRNDGGYLGYSEKIQKCVDYAEYLAWLRRNRKKDMKWIKVSDALPEIKPDGYSRFVLVYCGHRIFPEIAQYSPENTTLLRGSARKRKTHWWSNEHDDSDRNGPLLEPTHWCDIVYPKD